MAEGKRAPVRFLAVQSSNQLAIFLANALILACICIFSMTNCSSNRDFPIQCITEYVKANVNKKELDDFIKLNGIEVWRKWDNLTTKIANDNFAIENCGIYEYMDDRQTPMNTFKGKVTFVYLIHSYLKYGYINQKNVDLEVEKVIQN